MAASTAPINSSKCYVRISTDGGTTYSKLAEAKDASLKFAHKTRDTSAKSSGGWARKAEGQMSWSLSGGGMVVFSASDETPSDLFALATARTKIKVQFYFEETGNKSYAGDCYISQFDLESGGVEENVTYSFGFEGSEVLTETTNS